MKIGDLVKWRGSTATVVKVYRRNESSGNPNGDFDILLSYDIWCDGDMIRVKRQLPILNSG